MKYKKATQNTALNTLIISIPKTTPSYSNTLSLQHFKNAIDLYSNDWLLIGEMSWLVIADITAEEFANHFNKINKIEIGEKIKTTPNHSTISYIIFDIKIESHAGYLHPSYWDWIHEKIYNTSEVD